VALIHMKNEDQILAVHCTWKATTDYTCLIDLYGDRRL